MNERGFLNSTFAVYLIGLSLLVWFISFIMGWIYETKEQRTAANSLHARRQVAANLTKEEVLKYGIGDFEVKCSGLFVKKCNVINNE